MELPIDSFVVVGNETKSVTIQNGPQIFFISNVAVSNAGWKGASGDLVVNVLTLPTGQDRSKVTSVAVAYPTSFSIFQPGFIAVNSATAAVVSLPDGTEVVQMTANVFTHEESTLFRVGFQVTVVIDR
jgi:hypothetical protein